MGRRQKVSEMIDTMEKQGVVQPSANPWASPVVKTCTHCTESMISWMLLGEPNTSFKCLYEFTWMPFGLCNAPATFQQIMQKILGMEGFFFVYLDDIFVASKTFMENLEHLHEVFTYVLPVYDSNQESVACNQSCPSLAM